jgi:myo-inositol 2-dehydrogenase/D-chiro-inositol 1-dehydrogenase
MKKINFAVAGLGRIGKIHLENLLHMEGVDVVATMDPLEECQQYAKDKGIANVAGTFEEMLAIPEIDAVLICSPTDTHADFVELSS